MLNGRAELKERMARSISEPMQRSYSVSRPQVDFSRSAFSNVEYPQFNQKPSVSIRIPPFFQTDGLIVHKAMIVNISTEIEMKETV